MRPHYTTTAREKRTDDEQPTDIKFIGVARAQDRTLVASLTVQRGDVQDQYHTAVREVLSAPDFANKVTPGSRYKLVGDVNSFSFVTDPEARVYIVIHAQSYPERLVFPLINELITKFKAEFGAASTTCVAGALDGKAKRLFQALADDYDDPTKRDKISQVQAQVQDVKQVMHKNIDSIIQNIDVATEIEDATKRLQDQAERFDTQARTLKRRELWRKYKVTLAICLGLVLLIGVLLLAFQPWSIAGLGGGSPTPGIATQPPVPTIAPPTTSSGGGVPAPAPAPTAPGGITAPPVPPP